MTHAELDLMIVEVAAQHGRDGHGAEGLTGYLRLCAANHPEEFKRRLAQARVKGKANGRR